MAKDKPELLKKITELAKHCSAAWQALDRSKKASYEQQYRQELEDYTRQYLEYESKLSDEQRTALQIAKEEKTEDRKKRKLKKVGILFRIFNGVPLSTMKRSILFI